MQVIYAAVLCFVLGLWLALQQEAACWQWQAALLASAVMFAAGVRAQAALRCLCVCLSLLLLGLGNGWRVESSAAQQLELYYGRQTAAYGRIEPLSMRQADGYHSFIIQCEKLQINKETLPYKGRLRVSVRQKQALPECGQIKLAAKVEALTSFRNPGSFDGGRYNRVNGLGGRLKNARILSVQTQPTWRDRLELLNLQLCRRLEQGAGSTAGPLLGGMLLGSGSRLEAGTREIFAANGLSHLLSVSGTHLVLLAGLLSVLLQFVPPRRRRLLLALLLCLYAALCGGRPPVLRALLMSMAVLFGGAGAERGRLLCFTAIALLLFKPLWLLDVGFQLSFGAAGGLLWLLPRCRRAFPTCLPSVVSEGAAVTMAAQLGVLPFIIGYFHQVSVISIISNIILVPLLELAALFGLAGCLLPAGDCLLAAAGIFVRQALTQGEWLAKLPFGLLTVGELPLWCAVVYYGLLAVWADVPYLQFLRNKERRWAMGLLGIALSAALFWQTYAPRPLAAYFLDVGQGDCVVIVTPSRRVMVYDTGGLASLDTGSRVVAPFLRSLGFFAEDVLLLRHSELRRAYCASCALKKLCCRWNRRPLLPKLYAAI